MGCDRDGELMSDSLFEALLRQMRSDGRIIEGELGAVVPADELVWRRHCQEQGNDRILGRDFRRDVEARTGEGKLVRKKWSR